MEDIKTLLEKELAKRNTFFELSFNRPDPLLIAREYKDEYIALLCALFAYGNAKAIVKFLQKIDFSLLDASEEKITKEAKKYYYRFQKSQDVVEIFLILKRLKEIVSIENIVFRGYKKEQNLLDGLWELLKTINSLKRKNSYGVDFFFLNIPKELKKAGTYKRYFMYFRWMVRKDNLDLGLWKKIDKKDLIMPLDTHSFNVSRRLGLLQRKSCDLKAAIELTNTLKKFDAHDPIKYDFALYRLGQEKIV